MVTTETGKVLNQKQAELDQLIVEKSPVCLRWVSHSNAKRLKLALLVEVGEFANEIKSFKAWQKKLKIDGSKAKEELIDCLGYFLGLVAIYQIDFFASKLAFPQKEGEFNELLLNFFSKTNDLYVEEKEQFYDLENTEVIKDKAKNTYHEWGWTFEDMCRKLKIGESELLDVYLEKNKTNLKRVHAK